jgi:hypothetical protein
VHPRSLRTETSALRMIDFLNYDWPDTGARILGTLKCSDVAMPDASAMDCCCNIPVCESARAGIFTEFRLPGYGFSDYSRVQQPPSMGDVPPRPTFLSRAVQHSDHVIPQNWFPAPVRSVHHSPHSGTSHHSCFRSYSGHQF